MADKEPPKPPHVPPRPEPVKQVIKHSADTEKFEARAAPPTPKKD
jgi:hypothetical protein